MRVELVTRTGCHLCDEALDALRRSGVSPILRDVDSDAALFATYDFRVPVVLIDGKVIAEGRVDAAQVAQRLAGSVSVRPAAPEDAGEVFRLTRAAFAGYAWLRPPSGALTETEEQVRADLASGGGAMAEVGGTAVGCLRFGIDPGRLHVRRVAVDPAWQRRGVGTALMEWAHGRARAESLAEVWLGVRVQLPGNRDFYHRLGYQVVREHRHPGSDQVTWYEMARPV